MTQRDFENLIAQITETIQNRPLDKSLEADLNARYPAGSEFYRAIEQACAEGIAAGWMCSRSGGGIKYGRVTKPGPTTHEFSIDVVEMDTVAGPFHSHPNGEIDLVMPLEREAQFDGRVAGWVVYGPDSAHSPTVTLGRARVLYLLPGGAIEFRRS